MFRPTLIVAALCLLGVAIEARPPKKCVEKAADIMFVLDSSTSIWIRNYRKQLKFVAGLVDSFGVGKGNSKVRVGVITYSDNATLEFSLGRYTNPVQLKKNILKIPHRTGSTNTAAALKLLNEQVEPNLKNSKVPTIAVVITDGQSMDPAATKRESKKLHQLGVTVYAIGVGNSSMYDIDELKAIASDPDNGVYTVSTYSELKKIRQTFYVKACADRNSKSKRTTTTTTTEAPTTIRATAAPTTTTTTAAPTTTTTKASTTTEEEFQKDHPKESSIILFGYDTVAVGTYSSSMINQFINTLLPHTVYGHFGVVSYGYCPSTFDIPITSLMGKDPSTIKSSVIADVKLPDLADVVRKMRNILYSRSKLNANSGHIENQVAVLFVDPSVTTITQELTKEIEMLKKNGVKLYLITVGPCPNLGQLDSLSSQPYHNYMFNIPSYHQLVLKAQHNPIHFSSLYNQKVSNPSKPKEFQLS